MLHVHASARSGFVCCDLRTFTLELTCFNVIDYPVNAHVAVVHRDITLSHVESFLFDFALNFNLKDVMIALLCKCFSGSNQCLLFAFT